MTEMTAPTAASDRYARHYQAAKAGLPGAPLPWLAKRRDAGMERFAATGFPTTRDEAWKYTNLNALNSGAFEAASATHNGLVPAQLPTLLPTTTHRLCFANGFLRPDLSSLPALPEGVALTTLGSAADDDAALLKQLFSDDDASPLAGLNAALAQDGWLLRIGEGVVLEAPIEVIWLGGLGDTPVSYHTRNLIVAEAGSQATVIEHYHGLSAAPYFHNGTSNIVLGANARIRHRKVQAEGSGAFHLHDTRVLAAAGARYDSFVLALGAALSRQEIHVALNGEEAECLLAGAYVMNDRQHCDNTTVIEHVSPRTNSREVYKGVLDDRARAVFQGRITVRPDAQQINGHQLNKTLLLSDRAEIDSKPELEIFADDVKCSHGATAGELAEDELFYLRARGIPEAAARALLVQAFLAEALEEVGEDDLRGCFNDLLDARLSAVVPGARQ